MRVEPSPRVRTRTGAQGIRTPSRSSLPRTDTVGLDSCGNLQELTRVSGFRGHSDQQEGAYCHTTCANLIPLMAFWTLHVCTECSFGPARAGLGRMSSSISALLTGDTVLTSLANG